MNPTNPYDTIQQLREQVAAQAHELKTLRLQCISDFGQYVDGTQELKETIAAQAAVIEKLRDALLTCQKKQIIYECSAAQNYKTYDSGLVEQALAIPTDSTQILADVRRAERERVAQFVDDKFDFVGDEIIIADAIRAME